MIYNLLTSAKINLGLTVIGKLSDGYHEIESIFLPIGIFDKVYSKFCLKNKDKKLEIVLNPSVFGEDFKVPNDNRNTVWKVVEFVEKVVGKSIGFDIKVYKNIPVGSGLGGGSSNAGGILLALIDFLKRNNLLDKEKEEFIFSNVWNVGADIPFFLNSGGCIVQGRGEKVKKVDCLIDVFSKTFLVVVYPNLFSSTKDAFRFISENNLYDSRRWAFEISEKLVSCEIEISDLKEMLKNTFEQFIITKVIEIKSELYLRGAMFSLMSGSGSSVYGIFDVKKDAKIIKNYLISKFGKNYKIFVTRFVKNPVLFI